MITTTVHCDINGCKKEISTSKPVNMQVIFTTEQTEGRCVEPYFSFNDLDLCEDCLKKVFDGNYIFAYGAQGHNSFYFKK